MEYYKMWNKNQQEQAVSTLVVHRILTIGICMIGIGIPESISYSHDNW